MAVPHQGMRLVAVMIEPLRLEVWCVRTADVGPFVPVEAEPSQAVDDSLDHLPRRTFRIRIFDAQHERSFVTPRKEPVEERRPGAAHVQIPGRRRRKANADHLTDYRLIRGAGCGVRAAGRGVPKARGAGAKAPGAG